MSKQAGVNRELWKAVERSNEDAVRLLLKGGGDPNYKSFHISYVCSFVMEEKYTRSYFFTYWYGLYLLQNTTLLMVASDKGCQSIVQLLLKSGARVNESNSVSEITSKNVYWKTRNFVQLFKFH